MILSNKKGRKEKVGNEVNKYCKSILTDECFNLSCKSRVDYFLTGPRTPKPFLKQIVEKARLEKRSSDFRCAPAENATF